jgi:hypothetical protein
VHGNAQSGFLAYSHSTGFCTRHDKYARSCAGLLALPPHFRQSVCLGRKRSCPYRDAGCRRIPFMGCEGGAGLLPWARHESQLEISPEGDSVNALGSRLRVVEKSFSSALNKVFSGLESQMLQGSPIDQHNAYTTALVLKLLAATGSRPLAIRSNPRCTSILNITGCSSPTSWWSEQKAGGWFRYQSHFRSKSSATSATWRNSRHCSSPQNPLYLLGFAGCTNSMPLSCFRSSSICREMDGNLSRRMG